MNGKIFLLIFLKICDVKCSKLTYLFMRTLDLCYFANYILYYHKLFFVYVLEIMSSINIIAQFSESLFLYELIFKNDKFMYLIIHVGTFFFLIQLYLMQNLISMGICFLGWIPTNLIA